MENKHGGAELLVRAHPPINRQSFTIHVSASLRKLLELAEDLEVRKKDGNGILREFTVSELNEFCGGKSAEDLLTLAEKQSLVRHELENIRALLVACLHYKIIKQIFPLHDVQAVCKLGNSWYLPLYSKQPYETIREYFGESIALYFQFLGFYTYALLVPMILGFVQLLTSSGTLVYFSIINVIWAALFLELWRRKCTELAFTWGTISMTSLDEPRPNFRGVMGKDSVTDRLLPQYPRWKTNMKMYCVSLPLVILCMFGAFIVMLISFWCEDMLRKAGTFPPMVVYIPSTIYAGLIYVMNLIYRQFATYLTEWENHRTQSQFDRHRVTKLVLFEFVNNFMSLFYIAFIIQDLEMLRTDPYDDYLELFVQFGYVFLFSSVYPMAAFWAVFNNVLEIRSDAFKLCCVYQRPMARKVKDTGAWQRSFQALCTFAVITNCALLCFLPSLKNKSPDTDPTKWFLGFVLLEHALLGLKQVLHYAIPDKPEWVRIALARSNHLSKQALKRQVLKKESSDAK
ncbi:hypothetical protein AAG570_001708 [Ranatra chinensis]|uniref:Anoctamin n=1 Tax=Ranatra chinensis TaxID=642074 RepID=A0ABD0YVV1_9HEMI